MRSAWIAGLGKGEVCLVDGGDDSGAVGDPVFFDLPVVHLFFPVDDALVIFVRCEGISHHIAVQPFLQS